MVLVPRRSVWFKVSGIEVKASTSAGFDVQVSWKRYHVDHHAKQFEDLYSTSLIPG